MCWGGGGAKVITQNYCTLHFIEAIGDLLLLLHIYKSIFAQKNLTSLIMSSLSGHNATAACSDGTIRDNSLSFIQPLGRLENVLNVLQTMRDQGMNK